MLYTKSFEFLPSANNQYAQYLVMKYTFDVISKNSAYPEVKKISTYDFLYNSNTFTFRSMMHLEFIAIKRTIG